MNRLFHWSNLSNEIKVLDFLTRSSRLLQQVH